MIKEFKKILVLIESVIWLFKPGTLSTFIRVIIVLGTIGTTQYFNKNRTISYVQSLTRQHFIDPKVTIQDILSDLTVRCGKGCYVMKISLHNSARFHDGKPWSVFGYVKEIDQVMEVSSMEHANPLNKNRFSIQDNTYKNLIQNHTMGTVRSLGIDEIKSKYSDLAGLLTGLRMDIGKYMYTIQRNESGEVLWIVAIAVVKGFEPKCRYYGKDDCIDLILIKSRDIYKAWLSQEQFL